jgi:formylglycine-generating enzyme required for sulfatase activity
MASFLVLQPGTFKMGASESHQLAIREPTRSYYADWLRQTLASEDWETGLRAQTTDRFYSRTAQDRRSLQIHRSVLERALQAEREQPGRGLNVIMDHVYPMDETPAGQHEQQIESFAMSRMPTLNSWYRLFDPGHGLRGPSWLTEDYTTISESLRQPAIFLSWFDAWTCALWACWKGESCRLPWENEWEYAVKYGLPGECWDQHYWWGNEFDANRANANRKLGRTNEPTPDHASQGAKAIDEDGHGPGLMDMLGNVNEWCQDIYRQRYSRTTNDQIGDSGSYRVLRGGSWDYDPRDARCADRGWLAPDSRYIFTGFRLSRTS